MQNPKKLASRISLMKSYYNLSLVSGTTAVSTTPTCRRTQSSSAPEFALRWWSPNASPLTPAKTPWWPAPPARPASTSAPGSLPSLSTTTSSSATLRPATMPARCAEDEWSCHEKGESLAANNTRGKILIMIKSQLSIILYKTRCPSECVPTSWSQSIRELQWDFPFSSVQIIFLTYYLLETNNTEYSKHLLNRTSSIIILLNHST